MLESERQRYIAKLVQQRSTISISDLVTAMNFVSEATIRRDIKDLAERGHIRRVRGGIESIAEPLFPAPTPVGAAHSLELTKKRAIARAAADLIRTDDSIIIGPGSTTSHMVEFLQDRQLDVLTNSVFVAMRLFDSSRNRVMVPGGTMSREHGIVLSPYENDYVDQFWAEKMFTGCYAIGCVGLMESESLIVQSQRRLLTRADEVILLADSTKLRRRSSMIVAEISRISTLITDSGATDAELRPLRRAGLKIIVADDAAKTR